MRKYLDFGRFCIIFVPEFNEVETRDRLAIDPRQTRDNFLAKNRNLQKKSGKSTIFCGNICVCRRKAVPLYAFSRLAYLVRVAHVCMCMRGKRKVITINKLNKLQCLQFNN